MPLNGQCDLLFTIISNLRLCLPATFERASIVMHVFKSFYPGAATSFAAVPLVSSKQHQNNLVSSALKICLGLSLQHIKKILCDIFSCFNIHREFFSHTSNSRMPCWALNWCIECTHTINVRFLVIHFSLCNQYSKFFISP